MPKFDDDDAGYHWRCEHWGTKWDIDNGDDKVDVTRTVKDKSFNANFSTAWCPPIGALEKAKELGFEIRIYYREDNMGIDGVWDDGEDR